MRIAMLGLKGIPATYGGVERYTEEVATRLADRGHEVLVYCRRHYTSREVARKAYRGITLVRLPSLNLRATDTLSHTLLATLDMMRRGADVAIYHSLGNALYAALPRLAGIPTTLVLHGQEYRKSEWGWLARAFFRASEWVSLLGPTRVSVISHWLEEDFRQRHHAEVAFVSTGVALPAPRPPEHLAELGLQSRRYLLFVGRLVPQKGVHLLLEAYRGLRTDMPLVIVGDAPHQDAYHATLRQLATPEVRFLGFRYGEELAEVCSQAYVQIFPSEHEGIALALLEALAYNNCVVISDIPENLEAAGDLAFAHRHGDAADLRRVLDELTRHPEIVAERRGLGRRYVAERYNWDTVATRYEQLCQDLLTAHEEHTFTPEI
jgi:glycosyltransferase involved in cell wall biosynthesis